MRREFSLAQCLGISGSARPCGRRWRGLLQPRQVRVEQSKGERRRRRRGQQQRGLAGAEVSPVLVMDFQAGGQEVIGEMAIHS